MKNELENATILNSLTGLVTGLMGRNPVGGAQLSQTDTLFFNTRWYLISNFRQLLSELYVENGIVQTLVDQPVDDAFRTGFDIKTGELDAEDITALEVELERNNDIKQVIEAAKWARLFGGGAVLILTNQKPDTPLNAEQLKKDADLEFKAVDMWELYGNIQNIMNDDPYDQPLPEQSDYYFYYGTRIHKSRVYRIEGKKAPSFIRPRLRGWGMSEVEKVVRSLNQYMKNQDVVFELLDEAKIDVYKIKGFNAALMNSAGTQKVAERIQTGNQLKNYNNAISMDADDDYQQKQISFAGLSEILVQIRQGIAADLKMPVTKLFGISAAGFNSGEDDIENYNSMIESEIRSKIKHTVQDIVALRCRTMFGFAPEDLRIEFHPLRILSAKEEEEVKNYQYNRTLSAYQAGLIDGEISKQAINRDSLLPVEVDETSPTLPPLEDNYLTREGSSVDA